MGLAPIPWEAQGHGLSRNPFDPPSKGAA